jgi:hypothetical protein
MTKYQMWQLSCQITKHKPIARIFLKFLLKKRQVINYVLATKMLSIGQSQFGFQAGTQICCAYRLKSVNAAMHTKLEQLLVT